MMAGGNDVPGAVSCWLWRDAFAQSDERCLDQSQVRFYTAIARHTVLVMAALAICASWMVVFAMPDEVKEKFHAVPSLRSSDIR